MEFTEKLRMWVLQNAVKHKGKAAQGAIAGSIMNDDPDARSRMKEIMPQVAKVVQEVNALSFEEQKKELEQINPEFFEKKEHDMFAFLGIAEGQKVITAFPPGPEKYPHIGHAKALLLNYELAKKFNGKFLLRFEDTNPRLVKEEFYDIMQEDFKWLGVQWDDVIYASDYMELYEASVIRLIEEGNAYIDKSSPEDIKLSRSEAKASPTRELPPSEQMILWEEFKTSEEGTTIVRLKTDLAHKNSAMRDPTLYRIIEHPHARQGTKYRAWPSYDFQNAIMDGYTGVTHRLRSIEFEMRNELHNHIRSLLDLSPTVTYEFGRFNMTGVESSGRVIREKIENGELWGWDDPSLTTLVALRKRGFQPEAIKAFLFATGITKNIATLTWDDLYRQNTKIMDNQAKRFAFVSQPKEYALQGAEQEELSIVLHPQQDIGVKTINVGGPVYIDQKDVNKMKNGEIVRLMHYATVSVHDNTLTFVGKDIATFKGKGKKLVQFVSTSDAQPCKIIMPDKTIIEGFCDNEVRAEIDNCIQFERVGNVRVDRLEDGVIICYYTN